MGSSFVNEGLMLKVTTAGDLVWARRWDGALVEAGAHLESNSLVAALPGVAPQVRGDTGKS